MSRIIVIGLFLVGLFGIVGRGFSAPGSPEPGSLALLTGTVTDAQGAPIADATVIAPRLSLRTTTDESGGFTIADVPTGRCVLLVRHTGYGAVMTTVQVPAPGPLTVVLQATPFASPAVTVTATRTLHDPFTTPLPYAEVDPQQMRREPGVSLARAIDDVAGVRSLDTGQQIGKPVVRGLTGARVLVLDDGHRLEDYSWSDEDGPPVDAALAQRVEVIRGPASVLYGSDALGGVINAIPEPLPRARGRAPFTRVGAQLSLGSANAEVGAGVRVEGARENLGWRLAGIGRHADDMHTPTGEIPNTGFSAFNGEGAIGLWRADSQASLRYARYAGEYKLLEAGGPTMDTGNDAQEEGPERMVADDRVQLDGSLQRGAWRWEARTQWQRHSLIELSDEFPAAKAERKEATAFDLLLMTTTVDLLGHHDAGGSLRGTLGLSGALQNGDSRGPVVLVPDTDVRWGAAFATEELALGRWSLLAGARGDTRRLHADANDSVGNADETRTYRAVTGDLGAVYRVAPSVALAANVGRAWRAPSAFELFANGPRIGDLIYEHGNPELTTEKSLDLEASVRCRFARVHAEASVYRNLVDDFIHVAATGDSTGGLADYRAQQADAVLTGAEVTFGVQATSAVAVNASADLVRGSYRDSGAPLPLMPPRRGRVGVTWRVLAPSQPRISLVTELVGRQTRLGMFDVPVPGYVLLHLEAGITRTFAGRPLRLDLRVANLLDHAYRDFLSRYKTFALDPGRDISLRVAWAM